MTATLAQLQAAGAAALANAGVAEAALDARLLLQAASGLSHAGLIGAGRDPAGDKIARRFGELLARRAGREPVSRILGRREFFGLEISVSPAVLDPRPETELLVECALADHADRDRAWRFVDVGTGSGAIAIALLSRLPDATGVAVDLSGEALAVAMANARRCGVEARMEARTGNLLAGVEGRFDFLVANLPYIPTDTVADLEPEVRQFDPILALDGGPDGLAEFRKLFLQLENNPGLVRQAYLEIGAGQAGDVAAIARRHGWSVIAATPDLAGIDRVLTSKPAGD